MRTIITGGTGLIGRRLAAALAADGQEVVVLSREPGRGRAVLPAGVLAHHWDGRTGKGWFELIDERTAIVNLAGENPNPHRRWDAAYRRRFVQSRLGAAAAVFDAVERADRRPRLLLQASATGYYGDRADDVLTEDSGPGKNSFLARVCRRWEKAARSVAVPKSILRIGVVLSRDGGALPEFRRALSWRVRRLGSGRQWVPWVHEADVTAALRFLLDRPRPATGNPAGVAEVFNLVAPNPVPHDRLMELLAKRCRKQRVFPVPGFALRLAMGEVAEAVLDSQLVMPRALLDLEFKFRFPEIAAALQDLVG